MKTLIYFEYKDEETRNRVHEDFSSEMSRIGFSLYHRSNMAINEGGLSKVMTFNNVYQKYKHYFKYATIIRAQEADVTELNS
ncbi:hypothetical protein PBI_SCTP2_488 [Salicola phage SCTP-2]|nr:hypothetical protein PBI_SCTP2_488 [Salicola phage SCTP-2]